jgi:hypothetical protein
VTSTTPAISVSFVPGLNSNATSVRTSTPPNTYLNRPSASATQNGDSHHGGVSSNLVVGLGISLGFAAVIISMLLWQVFANFRRRRRHEELSKQFHAPPRDVPKKPGTGSSSECESVSEAGKREMVESHTVHVWPKSEGKSPESPGFPMPPSPAPASPMFNDPLLPKGVVSPTSPRPEMMEHPHHLRYEKRRASGR